MSLIVVGLNHRTVAGRAARAHDGARGAARRRCCTTSRRASTCSRSSCSPRATAPRSTRGARTSTPRSATSRDFLAALLGRRSRRVRRPPLHVLRRSRGRAPVLGRGRPRLDDRRRERDPRPGARRVADRGARRQTAPQLLSRHVPARGRVGQARAHRDRHRAGTRCRSRRPRSRSRPSTSATLDGATVLVIGAGQMGSGLASTLAVARRRARSGSRTARCERAEAARRPTSAREAIPLTDIADTLVDADVCSSSTASTEVLDRAGDGRDGDGVPRRPAAARSSTSRCRATSIPASARSPTSRCSTSTTSRTTRSARPSGAAARSARSARSSRPRSSGTAPSGPAARSAPLVTSLRELGEDVRARRARTLPRQARPARPRHARRWSTRSRRASSTSCCTSRRCA